MLNGQGTSVCYHSNFQPKSEVSSLLDHKDLCPEPLKLLVSDDVKECLQKAGYWDFLNLFEGFDLEVTNQLAWSWSDGKMMVGSFSFEITLALMTEIFRLVDDGVKIRKDKHPLATELDCKHALHQGLFLVVCKHAVRTLG